MDISPLDVRSEVVKFTQVMEEKLRAKDYKGGWKDSDPRYLFGLLLKEVQELKDEIYPPTCNCHEVTCEHSLSQAWWEPDSYKVAREAADIANFCLMISDVCGGLNNA